MNKGTLKTRETKYVTVTKAAELLGYTVQHTARLCRTGAFPGAQKVDPSKRNSPYIIPLDVVEAYIKNRAQDSEQS